MERSPSAIDVLLGCNRQAAAVHGPDGRIVRANEAYGRMLGCSPAQLVSLTVDDLVHPADRTMVRTALADACANEGGSEPTRTRLAHADGSWVVVDCLVDNLLGEPGIEGVLVTAWGDEAFEGRDPAAPPGDVARRETELAEGIAAGHVDVVYQPIVCLDHWLNHGAEALARWRTPGRVERLPEDFLPLAESSGLIVALGRSVLEQVAGAMAQAGPPVRVSVNLAARELRDPGLLALVVELLERHQVQPASLSFEVSETVALSDVAATCLVLEDLRSMGCTVGLDDVGGGFASLSQLNPMPVDFVKIDRAFVDTMLDLPNSLTVVSAIIRMAADQGVATIAEGVERSEQATWLRELGCDYSQGFLHGRPRDWLALPTPHVCHAV